MSQHHLLDSNIRLASFDDHYLYDSLSFANDTVEQDVPRLAQECFTLLTAMFGGKEPASLQTVLTAMLLLRYVESDPHDLRHFFLTISLKVGRKL